MTTQTSNRKDTSTMTTIYTDTETIAEIAHRIGLTQQGISGGGTKRKALIAELQTAIDSLYGLVDFAEGAQAERARRETEFQQTGTVTFSDNAA